MPTKIEFDPNQKYKCGSCGEVFTDRFGCFPPNSTLSNVECPCCGEEQLITMENDTMMTANRFDEIKTATKNYDQSHVTDLDLAGLGDIFGMLVECVAEIERLHTPAQATGRGHIKPVILDAKGNAIAPPPLVQQFAAERREQYQLDRHEALMSMDIKVWRVHALRWGLPPPPAGWNSVEQITNVMHAIRLGVESIPHFEKHKSALVLKARGIALPPGVKLEGGNLIGTTSPDAP